jgi:hypothetical protein
VLPYVKSSHQIPLPQGIWCLCKGKCILMTPVEDPRTQIGNNNLISVFTIQLSWTFKGFEALPVARFGTGRLLAVIWHKQALVAAAYFQTSHCQIDLVGQRACSSLHIAVEGVWVMGHALLQLSVQQNLPYNQGQNPRCSPTPPVVVHGQRLSVVVGLVFVCATDISGEHMTHHL